MSSTPRTERSTAPDRWLVLRRPLALGLACLATTTGVLLVPAAALAAEGVDASYNVGCSIHPDVGQESSQDGSGVAYDGERNDVTVSPERHTISAASTSVYPSGTSRTGEDCGVEGSYRDQLVVGPGSSGLAAGATVEVQISVRLDAELAETWDDDGFFQTRARYSARASVTDLDDCAPGPEGGSVCERPMEFGASHEHYLSGGPPEAWYPDGYVDAAASRDSWFRTNGGGEADENVDEYRQLCAAWPCSPDENSMHPEGQEPIVLTGPAVLVVGHRYGLVGDLRLFTQAYDNVDVRGTATVDEFSVAITPAGGYEGVDLAYASAGTGPEADTTPPEVVADVGPAGAGGWHTSAPTVALTATDAGSGVASISYSATGAAATGPTTVDGDSAELPIGTDGITEVTFQATDRAGNTSDPQTLTVRLDTVAPTMTGLNDIEVPADTSAGTSVPFTVAAHDALDDAPTVACDRASGSIFPVGSTTVTCTATDAAGNTATGAFTVTVEQPTAIDPMDRLGQAVKQLPMSAAARTVLTYAHALADRYLDSGQTRRGCLALTAMQVSILGLQVVEFWRPGFGVPTATARTLGDLIGQARAEYRC